MAWLLIMSNGQVLDAVELTRTYHDGRELRRSLDGVSLAIASGEVVAVMGPSGSGKTTLLHLVAGLDDPDDGQVCINGVDWTTLEGDARATFRRRTIGFIPQGYALLPQATAAENVEVPLLLDGIDRDSRVKRVAEALQRVGMDDQGAKIPDQLSGGEQQRVAVARAVINRPALILADEPTASLDSVTGATVVELLLACAGEEGAGILLATHDPAVADRTHRIVRLHSGRLYGLP
jgi:ABC-type lipoprotein export system ATPase subunit